MRGKDDFLGYLDIHKRITPAYAGKRSDNALGGCRVWDHPRICGEKRYRHAYTSIIVGSPPHMRGKARL